MTDKEIKKIAREYAESNIPHGIDEEYARSIIYTDGEIFERFLGWLSKTHCIVEKSKLKEWEDIVDDALKADHVITEPAWRFMWECLFGKDMFEEEKK